MRLSRLEQWFRGGRRTVSVSQDSELVFNLFQSEQQDRPPKGRSVIRSERCLFESKVVDIYLKKRHELKSITVCMFLNYTSKKNIYERE